MYQLDMESQCPTEYQADRSDPYYTDQKADLVQQHRNSLLGTLHNPLVSVGLSDWCMIQQCRDTGLILLFSRDSSAQQHMEKEGCLFLQFLEDMPVQQGKGCIDGMQLDYGNHCMFQPDIDVFDH
jgi:hypothetical protein